MTFDLIIKNGTVVTEQGVIQTDIGITGEKITWIGELNQMNSEGIIIDASRFVVFPGFIDPHVHFREPGPNEEEDFITGTRAAAAGGITTILEHPVDTPPTTTPEIFKRKLEDVAQKSYVDFGLWAGVIPSNLDQIETLAKLGACAFKAFVCSSDPYYPMVEDGELLLAMQKIASLGMLLGIHCENQFIINTFTKRNISQVIQNPEYYHLTRPEIAEVEAIERVISLAEDSNAKVHILHLSAAKGVENIERAKLRGVKVTVETCPHYLVLDNTAYRKFGAYAKCNPPIRDDINRANLWKAILDRKIDCIVSDHSPYTTSDKDLGKKDFSKAPPGINGLELGISLLYWSFIHKDPSGLQLLSQLMSTNTAKLFGLYPKKGCIELGSDADLSLFDPQMDWVVKSESLYTKNKWSPYNDWNLKGKIAKTIVRGKIVYENGDFPQGQGFGQFIPGKAFEDR